MDYKYIDQLLDRYWLGQTSLEEEEILRAFFSQDNLPESLGQYKPLFVYEHRQTHDCLLGDDFDERLLAIVDEPQPVKAQTITMRQRLMPLFRAAAIVAIVLTLGLAAQLSLSSDAYPTTPAAMAGQTEEGPSMALKTDSATVDTLKQSNLKTVPEQGEAILK